MDDTPNLKLPFILPAQAQKHVTHNEALRALDCIVQLSVADRDLATPPPSPAEGSRYIVATGPTGAWSGQAGHIAAWQDGAWSLYVPQEGWVAWVADEDILLAWDGAAWSVAGGGSVNPAPLVGINATADTTNRLSVKSDAVLLSHDDVSPGSGDMRAILNKAASVNTASFLLQTGFSGRAEIGLTGDDKLHIKTSPDGDVWNESMVIDTSTGRIGIGGVSVPEGPLHILRTGENPVHERIDNSTASPTFDSRKARGTVSAKAAVISGDVVQAFIGSGYDGAAYVICGNLRWRVDGAVSAGNVPTRVEFQTFTSGVGISSKFEVKENGTARPAIDNAYTLGDATNRWASVWAANGTIQTSDARDKTVAGRLTTFAGSLVDAVEPVLFRWNVGGNTVAQSATETETDDAGNAVPALEIVPRAGVRSHAGFLAQELKSAMDAAGVDFGAWGLADKDDAESRQWVRPDQLIAVLWAAVKETRAELAALRSELSAP